MANKKINQLDARVGLSDNDLLAVADPDTGFAYQASIADVVGIINTVLALTVTEVVYEADGSEGSSVTIATLIDATVIGLYRGGIRFNRVLSSPGAGQYVLTISTGQIDFNAGEPLVAGEKLVIDKISI